VKMGNAEDPSISALREVVKALAGSSFVPPSIISMANEAIDALAAKLPADSDSSRMRRLESLVRGLLEAGRARTYCQNQWLGLVEAANRELGVQGEGRQR
jgi:hypothetical protein